MLLGSENNTIFNIHASVSRSIAASSYRLTYSQTTVISGTTSTIQGMTSNIPLTTTAIGQMFNGDIFFSFPVSSLVLSPGRYLYCYKYNSETTCPYSNISISVNMSNYFSNGGFSNLTSNSLVGRNFMSNIEDSTYKGADQGIFYNQYQNIITTNTDGKQTMSRIYFYVTTEADATFYDRVYSAFKTTYSTSTLPTTLSYNKFAGRTDTMFLQLSLW